MNSALQSLQSYPFERLARLKSGVTPAAKPHISLSIGTPKHQPPALVFEQIHQHLGSVAEYPTTKGSLALRQSISQWLTQRYDLNQGQVDPETQIIPVSGTREALFAFAQVVVDKQADPVVIMPNPFYQIYEGAALLAGAQPYFLNTTSDNKYIPDLSSVPADIWRRCQLFYLCSPGNPTGAVLSQDWLSELIKLADRYDFVIASDECYSEIYFDETEAPIGLLQAAHALGRNKFERCMVFHSLSKRSNVPGLRSGFVAGDAALIKPFIQYRTYQGCSLPGYVQAASQALWGDEQHSIENRRLYREKFASVLKILNSALPVVKPDAAFYLWLKVPIDDQVFTKNLFQQQNVTVLPGSYLSRDAHGTNPGAMHVRIAIVATLEECIDAAERIVEFVKTL